MFDPRDDARDRDRREDGRARVYDERDRDDDPREGLMRDLDLPRGEERELVVVRDRLYELDGEDSRMLAAVGAFRVVPEHDLDIDHDTLEHLRDEGLVERLDLGDDGRVLTLTREGRDLLDSHSMNRDQEPSQAFYAGVSREREVEHDSNLYATYRQEEARLRDEHDGLEIRRVVLEQDLKREYQEFLQEHNRGRVDSDGRPDRDEGEIREWAREHDLPYFDGQVHFPDYRIEYEVDGEHHQDVELFTEHYRGAHAASHAQTGFRIYVVGSRGGRGRVDEATFYRGARRAVGRSPAAGRRAANGHYAYYHCQKQCRAVNVSKAVLEGAFADELALLQPSAGYMRLVKDRILYIWEQRRPEAKDRTVEQEKRVKLVQQKLDRLDDAFLFAQSIDAKTYKRQRDKLREELTLAQIDHLAEATDELDVQGILAFAERILPRASDLWVQASLDYKQRLQLLFFPEGIAFDGNRFNRTAVTAPLFSYLAPSESADERMVSPEGIVPARATAGCAACLKASVGNQF
jgi:hypothetical protein